MRMSVWILHSFAEENSPESVCVRFSIGLIYTELTTDERPALKYPSGKFF